MRFKPGNVPTGGHATRFTRGVSGNPGGRNRSKREFEEAFANALIEALPVETAAQLLAKSARNGDAWALQEVCRRYSPQTTNLKLEVENANNGFDLSRLSNDEFQQFSRLVEAAAEPGSSSSGESASIPQ
jgi:hypothetical protein